MKKQQIPAKILRYEEGRAVVACTAKWIEQGKYSFWSLTFVCPWCGRNHWHGGNEQEVPGDGDRASDCRMHRDNYILEVVETVGTWRDRYIERVRGLIK